MDVATEPVANHLTPDSLPLLTDTTIFDVGMNVVLFDTTDIQLLEVQIGSVPGTSDIFSHQFLFDVGGSLGGGLSYYRTGYVVHLDLGSLMQMQSYYSQVRIQKLDNSYSEAVVFNR